MKFVGSAKPEANDMKNDSKRLFSANYAGWVARSNCAAFAVARFFRHPCSHGICSR